MFASGTLTRSELAGAMVSLFLFLLVAPVRAGILTEVTVPAGDNLALINAIKAGNDNGGIILQIRIVEGPNGETEFDFTDEDDFFGTALPEVFGRIIIQSDLPGESALVTFKTSGPNAGKFPLLNVTGDGVLVMRKVRVQGFGTNSGSGGAIRASGNSRLTLLDCSFRDNGASGQGGAVAVTGSASLSALGCRFEDNSSNMYGGAVAILQNANLELSGCQFRDNSSLGSGCSVFVDTSQGFDSPSPPSIRRSEFRSSCASPSIKLLRGEVLMGGNTFRNTSGSVETRDDSRFWNALMEDVRGSSQLRSEAGSGLNKTCINDGGVIESLGWNLTRDDDCEFDQASDLVNTDPKLKDTEDDFAGLSADSPALDSGPVDVVVPIAGKPPVLPCALVDVAGTASPQDANDDGVFECDRGSWEMPGPGAIGAGHSGAFFNLERDGEGTYVEILNETTAVVYTFTYRPDGSGPAWFIGIGEIRGNSIVIRELLRPVGTSFGDDFDAADVEFSPAGGQNMVFNDCAAESPGGNVAYTGEMDLDYEALVTRAARLSHITGCGQETPGENAGLSGSYFDPARDGEGIVVQWLDNGDVLVVFFTYDQNDNQLWVIGIGTPNGKSVSMEALYASGVTAWGRQFKPEEITLSTWGTFSLTWTACGAVTFEFQSVVGGYGSGTLQYSRLSSLLGTSCPAFP